MKLLDAINGILSVLIVLLIIALPIALIGGGIYFMPGLLSTKKEEMTALKADYKKKLNDAIFYECFERYFSQSDFTLKDENSTLLKHNEKGEVSIDFSDMLENDDETITVQGVISSAQNQIENLAAIANLIKIIQLPTLGKGNLKRKKVCGYCGYHNCYLSGKQIFSKACVQKNCKYFRKENNKFWQNQGRFLLNYANKGENDNEQ